MTALKTIGSPSIARTAHTGYTKTTAAARQQKYLVGKVRMNTEPAQFAPSIEATGIDRIPPADAVRQFALSRRKNRKTALHNLKENTLPDTDNNNSASPGAGTKTRSIRVAHRSMRERVTVSAAAEAAAAATTPPPATTTIGTPPRTARASTAAARGFPGLTATPLSKFGFAQSKLLPATSPEVDADGTVPASLDISMASTPGSMKFGWSEDEQWDSEVEI
jgi:hypothetical protein